MFDVDIAQGGQEGLVAITKKGPYAVIISDLLMPGMDGFEFMEKAKHTAPDSVFIMLSGHADLDASLKALNEGNIFKFLTKPCKMHVLEKAIQAGIEQHDKTHQTVQTSNPAVVDHYRNKILIVDDDPEILSVFSTALNSISQFDVLTAENGGVALHILNIIQIDIMIADKEMPEMDGVKLLSSVRRNNPDMKLILMTWQPTPELKKEVSALGLAGFVEKTLDMQTALKTIQQRIHSRPMGQIDGFSTAAFLQMIELEEKTCTLQVHSGDQSGVLFFQKGQLIAAETGSLQNEEAAYDIINWKDASIEVDHVDHKKEAHINRPLIYILMEAARKQDETDMGE